MRVNDFFEKVYYINLDNRTGRRKRMNEVLGENSIEATRVSAVQGNQWGWKSDKYNPPLRAFEGVAGGTSTQISILREAIQDDKKSILILEDDCEFIPMFKEKFNEFSEDVPSDWDLLYLGGLNGTGERIEGVGPDVVKVTGMMSTHAYGVNSKAFKIVLDAMYGTFPYLKESADGYLRILQNVLNAYAFNPPMVWQIAGHSDIQGAHRDYTENFQRPLL
jgi:hypothetical protein